ncbi:MAG: hypothetical protein OXH54_00765 [Acidimicrobiaceae bacterium]|nr:hypothetical protein [Acidimicrobiaceae bacterium]MDE0492451.1 hypothetical protein [Acidimicrobiaceae bacterium]
MTVHGGDEQLLDDEKPERHDDPCHPPRRGDDGAHPDPGEQPQRQTGPYEGV